MAIRAKHLQGYNPLSTPMHSKVPSLSRRGYLLTFTRAIQCPLLITSTFIKHLCPQAKKKTFGYNTRKDVPPPRHATKGSLVHKERELSMCTAPPLLSHAPSGYCHQIGMQKVRHTEVGTSIHMININVGKIIHKAAAILVPEGTKPSQHAMRAPQMRIETKLVVYVTACKCMTHGQFAPTASTLSAHQCNEEPSHLQIKFRHHVQSVFTSPARVSALQHGCPACMENPLSSSCQALHSCILAGIWPPLEQLAHKLTSSFHSPSQRLLTSLRLRSPHSCALEWQWQGIGAPFLLLLPAPLLQK